MPTSVGFWKSYLPFSRASWKSDMPSSGNLNSASLMVPCINILLVSVLGVLQQPQGGSPLAQPIQIKITVISQPLVAITQSCMQPTTAAASHLYAWHSADYPVSRSSLHQPSRKSLVLDDPKYTSRPWMGSSSPSNVCSTTHHA